jgi:hypothetical protein
VLLIGGAVKKVVNDSGDDCLEAGKDLAGSLLGPASLSLAGGATTAALPQA